MNYINSSTFGVVIGGINVFGFVCTIIYIIVVLIKLGYEDEDVSNAHVVESATTVLYFMLFFCLIALFTSGLLIRGILKKRCSLMKPWIYSAIGGIVIQSIRVVINLFTALGNDDNAELETLFLNSIVLSLQVVIFYPIFTLFKEIRGPSTAQEESILNNRQQPPSYSEIENIGKTYN